VFALKNILVATDFGEAAVAALAYGRALARSFNSGLHVLNVTADVYPSIAGDMYIPASPELQQELADAARKRLEILTVDNDPSPLPVTRVVLTARPIAATIVEYAREKEIDLIVIGTHGRGLAAHLLMGSVAERVVRTAPCPVLTVRHPQREFVTPDARVAAAHA
jgi:nucleotide-binding universal stress UspA family protein